MINHIRNHNPFGALWAYIGLLAILALALMMHGCRSHKKMQSDLRTVCNADSVSVVRRAEKKIYIDSIMHSADLQFDSLLVSVATIDNVTESPKIIRVKAFNGSVRAAGTRITKSDQSSNLDDSTMRSEEHRLRTSNRIRDEPDKSGLAAAILILPIMIIAALFVVSRLKK